MNRERFDRSRSRQVAEQVARINARLVREEKPYILIGVGRWGASDPWLGIPVNWEQIAGARLIVETDFKDMKVAPSQGSHFFHSLTSAGVGYFTIGSENSDGFVDWDWLNGLPAEEGDELVRHIHLDEPLLALMDGRLGSGAIYKPGMVPEPEVSEEDEDEEVDVEVLR